MNKKHFIQIIIILVLLIGLAAYFYLDYYRRQQSTKNPELETINQIVSLKFIKQDISQELQKKYQEQFNEKAELFLKNPHGPEAFWPLIGLAQIKEMAGDYQGAKQALFWAQDLQPESFLVYGNLANIYFRQDKDFAKAEEYFLKAIKAESPRTIPYYLELHELYRYFIKQETSLAEDILKQGIEKYPDYPDTINLIATLAHYYKDLGRYFEAKEYYQKMLEMNPESEVAKRELAELTGMGY